MNNNKKENWMSAGGVKIQASARIILLTLVLGSYYLLETAGIIASAGQLWPDAVAILGAAYALFAYFWASKTSVPEKSALTATLFFDITMVTAASVMLGPVGTALFPLYLMIVFAYGLAFGEFHLQIAAGLSSLAFSVAYVVNPWWNDPVLAAGLLSSLFFLPLMLSYARSNNSRVDLAQRESTEEQTKAQALSELSQELHTQISDVITSSQGLLQQRNMSPQRKRLTRNIATSSASALRLVKEVDEYARLSSGQHEYGTQTASLVEILDQVSRQVTDEADKKQLNYEVVFDLELLKPVQTSVKEIKRVLDHLIFNAIKYTDKGYVRVLVKEIAVKGESYWRFEIEDSGVGIDAQEQKTVFDPFVRAHAGRIHETRGIGLGATISRQLVEGMGGQIGMKSKINGGSTFWFEAPIHPADQAEVEIASPVSLSCLSLDAREKQALEKIEKTGRVQTMQVYAHDFPDQASETAECLVVGEHVENQLFLQVLDTVAQNHDMPPPVIRFQRLQPDDLVIYSRQKGGDILFLPTSISQEHLHAMFGRCGRKPAVQEEVVEKPNDKLSVLIADGSNVSRDILATMLVNRGHQIYMARTPIQALDILSGIKLDLLLIDPNLADDKVLGGIEHCRSTGSKMKSVLLSDPSRSEELSAELKAHIAGEIPRPFQSATVYNTVETLFGLSPRQNESGQKEPGVMEKMLFSNDPALMDPSILNELDQVDSGGVLVNRFIQRYSERSAELVEKFASACAQPHFDVALSAAEDLADASEQIGLHQLAGYCKRLTTLEEADFLKRAISYKDEVVNLHVRSMDMLKNFSQRERRS